MKNEIIERTQEYLLVSSTKGRTFKISPEDEDILQYYWFTAKDGSVRTNINNSKDKMSLHRYLCNFPIGKDIDHIDRDESNNTRNNLRICEHSQNMLNRISRIGSSKYKGVCYRKAYTLKWTACIMYNGTNHYIGRFATENEAAQAYNDKALELHGEYACLNIIT